MALTINTNLASIISQRNLENSSSSLNKSIERLSSGLRINSASDDAAGMAISSRMTSQLNGMEQAKRNANDAISLSQTAEGAMGEQVDMLQRVRELAVQSSNGILSSSDRTKLDNEAQALMSEIDRVAKTTSFNGVNLLDGVSEISKTSGAGADFQVGQNAGQSLNLKTVDSTKSGLSLDDYASSGAAGATIANATNAESFKIVSDISGSDVLTSVSITAQADASSKVTALMDAINEKTSETGVLAVSNTAGDGIELRAADGVDAELVTSASTERAAGTGTAVTTADFGLANADLGQTGSALDITSQDGAKTAILQIDKALETVQNSRSSMGSYQNRFEASISVLDTSMQSMEASRSRIRDADFAKETALMTKNQIVAQAGLSMLSQANVMPQQALSLLN